MTTLALSLQEVHDIAKAVVEERGRTYVYDNDNGCYYYEESGDPSCMVGAVFAKKNIPAFTDHQAWMKMGLYEDDLAEINGASFSDLTVTDEWESSSFPAFEVRCDRPTKRFLDTLQAEQDTGWSWERALVMAEARVDLIDQDAFEIRYRKGIERQRLAHWDEYKVDPYSREEDVNSELQSAVERLNTWRILDAGVDRKKQFEAEEREADAKALAEVEAEGETVVVTDWTLDTALFVHTNNTTEKEMANA